MKKKTMKLTSFRIDESLKKLAYQSITYRYNENSKADRPEQFSEYLRNLIEEDWKKNKTKIMEQLKLNEEEDSIDSNTKDNEDG